MSRLRRRYADAPAATFFLELNWGFAPRAGKGAVPEAPRFACAPAALILARTTPILAEGQRFSTAEPE